MSQTDSQLIVDYFNGNVTAFEELVGRYLQPIYTFVFGFCRNAEEASDLTQEVFLKAWKNLKKFNLERNFKTWIFTIARNTVFDWLRKKKSVLFSDLDTDETTFSETLSDTEPLADELFMRKELVKDLERALDKIPVDSKVILLLYHREECTFEEIAEIVGKPMNTVKSQYRRALMLLRKQLAGI